MSADFMVQDIVATAAGFLLFPLLLIAPGYAAGWFFDLFDFRRSRFGVRLSRSLLLSVALTPICLYLPARFLTFTGAFVLLAFFLLAFVFSLLADRPDLQFRDSGTGGALACAILLLLLTFFSVIDIQVSKKLFFTVASFDHTTRISILDAITRTGVPPENPSYYPGAPALLSAVYYYWYILGSAVDRLGGALVSPRGAFFSSILWCVLAVLSLISFYFNFRAPLPDNNRRRLLLIGFGLLFVSGLDFIPILLAMGSGVTVNDIEHWNEQITAWVGSLIWVPHHLAGMIACSMGVFLIFSLDENTRPGRRIATPILAGMAFASGAGLSTWVTFVFAVFWALWILASALDANARKIVPSALAAGTVGLLLSIPFLLGALEGGGAGGTFPVALEPRPFFVIDRLFADSPQWLLFVLRAVFLPVNYFFELGFFMAAGYAWIRRSSLRTPGRRIQKMEMLLLLASALTGTFLQSTIIANNDLGWRSWLPGQFILLIWAGDILQGWMSNGTLFSFRTKIALLLLLFFGVVTSVMDLVFLRASYILYSPEIGNDVYSARSMYAAIDENAPVDAIVQYNPTRVIDRPSGLYGNRQSVISDRTAYGIPDSLFDEKVNEVRRVFEIENLKDWRLADSLCSELGIDILALNKKDPIWGSLEELKARRRPLYLDANYAAFYCGINPAPAP